MDLLTFTLLLTAGSVLAGVLASLTGLGGGIVLVPLMVMAFHVDLKYAVGASLIAVIATSSGAAAAYVREGFTNVRVGVLLEVATVAGALAGAGLAAYVPKPALAVLFGVVALYSAYHAARQPRTTVGDDVPDPLATRLKLDSTYPTEKGLVAYRVRGVPGALVVMGFAGVLSALVGVGSGFLKVIAMDRMMRLPFKVSTTTSNFMIGVTAAASSGVYLHRGQLDPSICAPVVLGALAGSFFGAKLLARAKTRVLRIIFAVAVAATGVEMIRRGLTGGVG